MNLMKVMLYQQRHNYVYHDPLSGCTVDAAASYVDLLVLGNHEK